MIKRGFYLLLIITSIVLNSCGQYQKLLKSSDKELKYKTAVEYFESENYYRSITLFEDIKVSYKGTPKDEEIHYYIANSYYIQRDYVLAAYYFDQYAKTFPLSDKLEDAVFLKAYCYYLNSPKYSLDQSNTDLAIQELQSFINQYPNSSRIEECNRLIDDLREKLEKKAFEIAMLFYKISDYQAAIVAFGTLLEDYPGTKNKENILFYTLKSSYIYASNSVNEKQQERYQATFKSYENLVKYFPESVHIKEAKKIYQNSLKFKI
ncbi:MAG: outer membrane protein assembly factor BamD [Bacteroidetes bacterium]|nr:outer membrane protein assembly factor BamD [Bacteroidota bacterium]